MKKGDYVRVLHGTEEGHITRLIDKDYVEIETSDGFAIPVSRQELVFVSPDETTRFGEANAGLRTDQVRSSPTESHVEPAPEETMLGLVPEDDGAFVFWLTNATACTLLYSLYLQNSGKYRGLASGHVAPDQIEHIAQLAIREVKAGTVCVLQGIFHPTGSSECPMPVEVSVRPWHLVKDGHKRQLTSIGKNGYRIDLLQSSQSIDAETLRGSLLGENKPAREANYSLLAKESEPVIDLHIEALADEPQLLTSQEILEMQLRTFEKALDNAIAGNVKSIKFIHGVGKGTLRFRIHKKLSQLQNILYYRDADKEKFGFGATVIQLK